MLGWALNLGFAGSEAATTAALLPFRRLGLGLSAFILFMLVPL